MKNKVIAKLTLKIKKHKLFSLINDEENVIIINVILINNFINCFINDLIDDDEKK